MDSASGPFSETASVTPPRQSKHVKQDTNTTRRFFTIKVLSFLVYRNSSRLVLLDNLTSGFERPWVKISY